MLTVMGSNKIRQLCCEMLVVSNLVGKAEAQFEQIAHALLGYSL
jgi:hypothetical protein